MRVKPLTPVALLVGAVALIPGAGEARNGNAHTVGAMEAPGQQPPSVVEVPANEGTAVAGQTLTASTGSWDGVGIEYGYQWQHCDTAGNECVRLAGAEGSTYVLASSDVGYTMRVTVIATNQNGSAEATSDPSATVAPPPAAAPTPVPTSTSTATATTATTTAATTTAATTTALTTTAAAVGRPTIVVTKVGDVGGSTPAYGTFGSWNQHVVSNAGGIFVAYSSYDSNHSPDYWRLARSTDGGKSFQTIYDGQQDGSLASAPAIETDPAGNVYVIAETVQSGSWLTGPTLFYRFDAARDYQSPLLVRLAIGGGAKFSTVYDRTRNVIDLLLWPFWVSHSTFFSIDTNGVVQKSVNLFTAQTEPHAQPHYPNLTIGADGTIFAGWSTLDSALWNGGAGTQNYYDSHFVASNDGGTTWIGKNGTVSLPLTGDDTGPAFSIVDMSNPSEFVPWGSSTYKGNWNILQGLAYNKGELHFYYGGSLPTQHTPYARMNWSTRTIDRRISPYFRSDDGWTFADGGGDFSQDSTGTGRLYFVGDAGGSNYGRLGAIYSDDGGTTWHNYALSDSWSGVGGYVNTSRSLMADGSLAGSFTYNSGTQTSVYFFRTILQ